VRTLKDAFQKELEAKEQEIEMLNSLVINKNQNNPQNKVNVIQFLCNFFHFYNKGKIPYSKL
jgi:hypothetical protein